MRNVYCIEALDDITLAYKVGIASCPERRVREMQTSNHALLRLITHFPCYNDTAVEAFLHELMSSHRIRGEWFRPDSFVLKTLTFCADLFLGLSEEQNKLLCDSCIGPNATDGWLYRRLKGFSEEPVPSWLRLAQ